MSPQNLRAALIDEFGALCATLRGRKALEKRYEILRKRILEPYAAAAPEQTIYEDGVRYAIQIGPQAECRSILSMAGLYHKLGAHLFFELCSVSLEKLDDVILPRDMQGLISTGRTGPRTVSASERFTEAAVSQ